MTTKPPNIVLVAGEASGDQLGAALMEQLRSRYPGARFAGVGGKHMQAAGLDAWWDVEELALFGLVEVLAHLPRLYRMRLQLIRKIVSFNPDVFIGIDAPDFNLGLEIRLRSRGIPTVQYVSPTVWAWRRRRVRKISRAADLVLCLFPFEPEFFRDHGIRAVFVGHPMADQINAVSDTAGARGRLGLPQQAPTVALLPGSRKSEVSRLAKPMIDAARRLQAHQPETRIVAAIANDAVGELFGESMAKSGFEAIRQVKDQPRTVIAAADVVICASGTAALETLLINRPMVVTYRLAPATYQAVRRLRMIKTRSISLPNILAGEPLVPELIQGQCTGENLAREARRWLDDAAARAELEHRFHDIHDRLRCNASERAAVAVGELLDS